MRRLALFVLASLWYGAPAAAGVDLGGNLPTHIWRQMETSAQRFTLRGHIKAVRWVHQTGRSVTRSVDLSLGDALLLAAPAGSWTDVELIFDGAPQLDGRSLPMSSLSIALDEPLDSLGERVLLQLDLSALDAVALTGLSDREIARALADGAGARAALLDDQD